MTDKAQSILTAGMAMLPYKFFDLEDALRTKSELESRFEIEVPALFHSQRKLDKIKNSGRRNFHALCALYFSSFNGPRGFDLSRLENDLLKHKSVMERHLGKEFLFTLDLLVKVQKEIEPKQAAPRGLLQRAV
jgi:hypothetical protein